LQFEPLRAARSIFFALTVCALTIFVTRAPAIAQQRTGPSGQLISNNQAAPPQCDANCVRTNAAKAADACAPRIEAQAPSSFNWMSRPNAGIFQQADPSSPGDTIVRYRGDSIRFLTADKSWLRVSYECAYDVRSGIVDFVKVRSGGLDQPLGPANVQASAGQPAAVQSGALAAAIRAAVPGAAITSSALVKPKKRVRVWEPSSVEIQQQNPNPRPNPHST
jgi:hypothetical protein